MRKISDFLNDSEIAIRDKSIESLNNSRSLSEGGFDPENETPRKKKIHKLTLKVAELKREKEEIEAVNK